MSLLRHYGIILMRPDWMELIWSFPVEIFLPSICLFWLPFSAGRYCMFMAIMTIAMRILPRRGAFALMTGYMNLRESAVPVLEVPWSTVMEPFSIRKGRCSSVPLSCSAGFSVTGVWIFWFPMRLLMALTMGQTCLTGDFNVSTAYWKNIIPDILFTDTCIFHIVPCRRGF